MQQLAAVTELDAEYDVVVLGAGPAGLAAATMAASHDLSVVLIDESGAVGGQIYRGLGDAPVARRRILGAGYRQGDALLQAFAASGANYMPRALVWSVSDGAELGVSSGGRSRMIRFRRSILACGALERPFPIPGWTLPGVMTAGAGQTLLKSSGILPAGRCVLAGTGPLLWQLASQLLSAGAAPAALLDTGSAAQRRSAVAQVPNFLRSPYWLDGLALFQKVYRAIPVIFGVTELAAAGEGNVSRVTFRRGEGPIESMGADLLLLHQGVVPNIQLPSAAGCKLFWDDTQACWTPRVDEWGCTSVDSIAIAGDGAGIRGSQSAAQLGALCGLDAAMKLGRLDRQRRDTAASGFRRNLHRFARGRRFLDTAFLPSREWRLPSPDTVVCRCEEITARQIVDVLASMTVAGPNQLKAYLRCGMGPCQGSLCGSTVTELIAEHRGLSPSEVGHYRLRFPIKPITVAEIASLPHAAADIGAVARE